MSSSAQHTTFTVERDLPGSPRHAFRFWSEHALKRRWSSCHESWTTLEDTFDFRAGGSEVMRWRTPQGEEHAFRAHYFDIVPTERIVYAFEMTRDGQRLSASLATVQFSARATRTLMTFTEQAAVLDGHIDISGRPAGTDLGFDRLAAAVARDLPLPA